MKVFAAIIALALSQKSYAQRTDYVKPFQETFFPEETKETQQTFVRV